MKLLFMKMFLGFILISLFFSFRTGPAASAKDNIIGIWQTGEGPAKIEIVRVGNKYNGKLVWLKEPLDKNGKPKLDGNNPDAAKRNQPIIGLELLRGFEYIEKNKAWENGKIYDPESGKEYNCIITMPNYNTLNVRGYIGFSWIGRTDTWKRTSL